MMEEYAKNTVCERTPYTFKLSLNHGTDEFVYTLYSKQTYTYDTPEYHVCKLTVGETSPEGLNSTRPGRSDHVVDVDVTSYTEKGGLHAVIIKLWGH